MKWGIVQNLRYVYDVERTKLLNLWSLGEHKNVTHVLYNERKFQMEFVCTGNRTQIFLMETNSRLYVMWRNSNYSLDSVNFIFPETTCLRMMHIDVNGN